jgi:hypothetical protein
MNKAGYNSMTDKQRRCVALISLGAGETDPAEEFRPALAEYDTPDGSAPR